MKKNTNILLAIGGVLAAVGIGYALVSKSADAATTTDVSGSLGSGGVPGSGGGTVPVIGNDTSLDMNHILKYQSGYFDKYRNEVKYLQNVLNKMDTQGKLPALKIDGMFGPKTQAKLVALTGLKQITLGQLRVSYAQFI